jgi:hypothetical protein
LKKIENQKLIKKRKLIMIDLMKLLIERSKRSKKEYLRVKVIPSQFLSTPKTQSNKKEQI